MQTLWGVHPTGIFVDLPIRKYRPSLMTWSVIGAVARFVIGLCSGLLVRGWVLSLLLGMRFLLGLGLLLMHWRLRLCLRLQMGFWLSLGLLLGGGLLLLMLWLLRLGRLLLRISFLFGRSL